MEREFMLSKLNEIIKPIIDNQGYQLYYIEYVEEDGENYLRIYIDNDEGITLQDCEKVSRAVSDMLDIEDPIPDSYYLEVSSPGIYRTLFTDDHLAKYNGYKVTINLKSAVNGSKTLTGELRNFDTNYIYINKEDTELELSRNNIESISLEGSLKEVNTNE